MKRKLFFWLEKLKIAPGERKAVSGLLMLLVILGGLNFALSPSTPFEGDHYRELEEQFAERTAMLSAEEEKLMEQYYPSAQKPFAIVSIDTIANDSTSNKELDKPKRKTEEIEPNAVEERVNVNTAAQKNLESLPGIGPTYAKRIIKYRAENGDFESVDELKKIKGIAQKRLDKLKPFIKLKDSE